MKAISNPADKKKAVILAVGCVVTFIFIVKTALGANSSGGVPPPPEMVVVGKDGAEKTVAAPPPGGTPSGEKVVVSTLSPVAAPKDSDDQIDPPVFLASEIKNPFHKNTDGYTGSLAVANSGAATVEIGTNPVPLGTKRSGPRTRRGNSRNSEGIYPVDPTEFKGPIGDGGKASDQTTAVVAKQDAPDTMEVKGVMLGAKPLAIVSVGGKEYIVDKGSTFAKDLRLKEVSASQVVIEQGGELHILRVGSHPAPPPSTPSTPTPTTKGSGTS